MTATLENITTKIVGSYSTSLSEKEKIDNILDHINDKKAEYNDLTSSLARLSSLLTQITWLDNLKNSDEVIIKGILTMGTEADTHFKKYYASERRDYASKGWFKDEFKNLKTAIDFHIETVLEVNHIIFDLRKNSKFNDLYDLINDL